MHSLDRFLFCISGLKNLEVLYLDKTSVSDEGASVIKCKFYVVQKCTKMYMKNNFMNRNEKIRQ